MGMISSVVLDGLAATRSAFARGIIGAAATAGDSSLMQRGLLHHGMRWIGNHVVPWAARSAFRAGVTEVNGVLLEVPRPRDWGGGGEFHMALGTYEKAEMRFLLSRLRPGQTFVDVGSHIGYVALPVARVLGRDGRVFCFEPTPDTFDRLRANVERNRLTNVTLVPAAAADRDGEAILACSDDSVMWNSLARGGARGVQVATRSIDSVLSEAGWPEVAALKIDAEGAEWEVLSGAEGALARNANAFLLVEVDGGVRRQESLRLLRFLVSRGYRLSRFTWSGPQPESLASLERRLSTNSRPWANVLAESSAGS